MRNLIEEGREVEGFFQALPADDPHHAQPVPVRKKRVLKKDRALPLFEGGAEDGSRI
jgi:hypothetical protein